MRFYDTHCHLYEPVFDADRDQVTRRMAEAGVIRALLIGYNLETSRQACDLAGRSDALRCAVGVHPQYAGAWTGDTPAALAELCALGETRAVGEIGLDARLDVPMDRQLLVCEAQLRLAEETHLPVCLHVVRAHEPMLALLRRIRPALPGGVCHGFSGSWETAQQYLKLGFHIGLGGPVTWPGARKAADCARAIPIEKLLLETDSPFQAAEPRRGGRGEPSDLPVICARVAEIRCVPPEEVAEAAWRNAVALFGG